MTYQEEIVLKHASKFKGSLYKRPEYVKVPRVWQKFEGKTPRADGTFPKYIIQDITEDWVEEILNHARNHLQETMGIEGYQSKGEQTAKFLGAYWSIALKDQVGLMCLTDDEEAPRLAGFQINEISSRLRTEDDCTIEGGDEKNTSDLISVMEIRRDINVFEKYNVAAYMDAWGLFVKVEFRNQGIGYHLQHAKIALCKALGIKLIANGFGSEIATHTARKVGFKLLDKRPMSEINDLTVQPPSNNQYHEFYAMEVE